MTSTAPTPLDAAIAAALEQRPKVGGDLIRTSSALATIRDAEGAYFVFRLKRRAAGSRPDSASLGYWIDVSRGGSVWEPCGIARENGTLVSTRISTRDPRALDAARIALRAIADRRRVVERQGRTFTVLVEDR